MNLAPGTSRMNFSNIKKKYANINKGNVRLTQSSLFLTQLISPSKTVYTFPVLETETDANTDNAEIRLNINDEFIITSMFIGLYGKLGYTREQVATETKRLYSYAPIQQNRNFANVHGLYYGKFKLAVNNIVYVEKWDTKKHEFVPRTQYNQSIAVGLNGATEPSNDWSADGSFPFQPMTTLSGAKKNELTIELPAAITSAAGTCGDNAQDSYNLTIDRIAILLRGYNAQNAARFQ